MAMMLLDMLLGRMVLEVQTGWAERPGWPTERRVPWSLIHGGPLVHVGLSNATAGAPSLAATIKPPTLSWAQPSPLSLESLWGTPPQQGPACFSKSLSRFLIAPVESDSNHLSPDQ